MEQIEKLKDALKAGEFKKSPRAVEVAEKIVDCAGPEILALCKIGAKAALAPATLGWPVKQHDYALEIVTALTIVEVTGR